MIRPGLEQCFDGLLQVTAILNQFGHHFGVAHHLTSTRIEKLASLFVSGSGKGEHQLVTAGIKLLRLLLDSKCWYLLDVLTDLMVVQMMTN